MDFFEQAKPLMESGEIGKLADPRLKCYDAKELQRVVLAASCCVRQSSVERPTMSEVCFDNVIDEYDHIIYNGVCGLNYEFEWTQLVVLKKSVNTILLLSFSKPLKEEREGHHFKVGKKIH